MPMIMPIIIIMPIITMPIIMPIIIMPIITMPIIMLIIHLYNMLRICIIILIMIIMLIIRIMMMMMMMMMLGPRNGLSFRNGLLKQQRQNISKARVDNTPWLRPRQQDR